MSGANIVRNVTLRLNIENGTAPPDWSSYQSGVRNYYSSVVTGSQEASEAIAGVGQSVEEMDSAVRHAVSEIEMLIGSGANWDQLSDSVRRFSEMTADAMGSLNPDERAQAIEQIMTNAKEQYDQVSAAAEAAGQRMSRSWASAANSMTQAISAASRLVVSIGFLTGSEKSVEALSKQFASVQIALQALSAQGAMFNNMSESLQKLQTASTAAQTQLKILGANAGFATRSMAALGPAAVSAQAALAPISLIFAGISLAVVAAQVAMSAFGDAAENDAKRASDAAAAYRKELAAISDQMRSQTAEIGVQQQATMALFEARKLANGGAFTAQEVIDLQNQQMQDLERQKPSQFRAAVTKAQSLVPEDVVGRLRELERNLADKDPSNLSMSEKIDSGLSSILGERIRKQKQAEYQEAQNALTTYRENNGLNVLGRVSQLGPDNPLAVDRELKNLPESMKEVANVIREAMVKQSTDPIEVFRKTITDLDSLIREDLSKVRQAGAEAVLGADGRYAVNFDDEIDRAQKQLEKERAIAQSFDANPAKLQEMQSSIQFAPNPLAGLDAIRSVLQPEQEQELRAKTDLNRQDLQNALADAREFETELQQVKDLVEAQNQNAQSMADILNTLVDQKQVEQEKVKMAAEKLQLYEQQLRQ